MEYSPSLSLSLSRARARACVCERACGSVCTVGCRYVASEAHIQTCMGINVDASGGGALECNAKVWQMDINLVTANCDKQLLQICTS